MHNSSNHFDIIIQQEVELSLAIVFTILYAILFLSAYSQLWLVLILKYKLVSSQTIYFFLCCIFSGLRIVLFSFFYKDIDQAMNMSAFVYWLLMCLPLIVQYLIVLLITLFYYKTFARVNESNKSNKRLMYCLGIAAVVVMIVVNLLPLCYRNMTDKDKRVLKLTLILVRVVITDLIFLITIAVFVHVYRRFPSFPNAMLVQEVKRITPLRSVITSVLTLLVISSKLIYDLINLSMRYSNTTTGNVRLPSVLLQADFVTLHKERWAFVMFGVLLFFWEVLPLIVVMIIFKVHLPTSCKIQSKSTSGRFYQPLNSNQPSNSTTVSTSSPIRSNFLPASRYGSVTIGSSDISSGAMSPVWHSPTLLHHQQPQQQVRWATLQSMDSVGARSAAISQLLLRHSNSSVWSTREPSNSWVGEESRHRPRHPAGGAALAEPHQGILKRVHSATQKPAIH